MKHAYAELFTAKLNDTSLVLFEKHEEWKEWREVTKSDLVFVVGGNFDYFLCLPQHKEVCLHWLNGGEAASSNTDARDGAIHAYNGTWSRNHYFMSVVHTMRIKPKKEKRWIGVYGKHVTENYFGSKSEAEKHVDESPVYSNCAHNWWQFIEIEIEATN